MNFHPVRGGSVPLRMRGLVRNEVPTRQRDQVEKKGKVRGCNGGVPSIEIMLMRPPGE